MGVNNEIQTTKQVLRDMRKVFVSSAKSLAALGFIFSLVDGTLQAVLF